MKVKQLGQNCLRFSVSSPDESRKKVDILLDPFGPDLKSVSLEADIVLSTKEANELAKVAGKPFVISSAGEYEAKGIFIQGFDDLAQKDKTASIFYFIRSADAKVCYLGQLRQTELTSEQLEEMGPVDILVIPLNNQETCGVKEASNFISQIEPKMIVFAKQDIKKEKLDKFLKDFGSKGLEQAEELDIKADELDEEKKKFAIISPSNGR